MQESAFVKPMFNMLLIVQENPICFWNEDRIGRVSIKNTADFKRLARPLLKKYPSLRAELEELQSKPVSNPTTGMSLGNNAYKVRPASRSKEKGKSGGARVITHLQSEIVLRTDVSAWQFETVSLIAIQDASEVGSISNKELKKACRTSQVNG